MEENCLSVCPPPDIDAIKKMLVASSDVKEYCNWGNNSIPHIDLNPVTLIELNLVEYVSENYKAIFISLFKDDKGTFDTPKLNVSQFEGCPHFYGKIYWRNGIYELQQEITEKFLKEGKTTGGDWEGYKVGDYTQRFLSRESLNEAFNKIKEKMINDQRRY